MWISDGAAAIVLSPNGDQIYTAGQNSDAIVMATRVLPPDVVVLSPGEIVGQVDALGLWQLAMGSPAAYDSLYL